MDYIRLHDFYNPKTSIVVSCSEIAAIEQGSKLNSNADFSNLEGCKEFGSKITMKYCFPHNQYERVTFYVAESTEHIYSYLNK